MAELLSDNFRNLKEEFSQHDLSVFQLLEKLGDKAHATVIIILSLPFCTPIPIPGLSTLLGMMISIVISCWFFHRNIWLPQKMSNYILSGVLFSKIFSYGEKYARKFEHIPKARGDSFFKSSVTRTLLFILILTSAVFLALPLPPGTNFPPAAVLIALSLAILYEDIYLLLIGIFVYLIQVYLLVYVILFLINHALPYIKSFLN